MLVNSGTLFDVTVSGPADGIADTSNAGVLVLSAGSVNDATVYGYAILSSGQVSGLTVASHGAVDLESGVTVASGAIVSNGGIVFVNSGALLSGATVSGAAQIISGRDATDAEVIIRSGASVDATSFGSGGYANIEGGTLADATLTSGATANVFSGTVSGTAFGSGAQLGVYGGTVGGTNTFASGADITVGATYNPGSATAIDHYTWSLSSFSGGGLLSGTTLNNGVSATLLSGGTITNTTLTSGASIVGSGGALGNTVISQGALVSVTSNVSLTGVTTDYGMLSGGVVSGAVVNVISGGAANTVTVGSSGLLTVASGAVANTTVQAGGVLSGGAAGAYTGTTTVQSGGSVVTGEVHGNLDLNNGASATSLWVMSGGSVAASSGSVLSGSTTVSAGGVVSMASGATMGSGANIWIRDGGSATIWNNAGGSVNLQGSTNTGLVVSGLSNGGTLSTVISGFDGTSAGNSDGIELAGVTAADVKPNGVSYPDNDHVTLALTNGQTITMNIVGVGTYGYTLGTAGDGDLVFEVCFLAGSMIRTPSGDVAVEELRIGDTVMTWDWKAQTEAERPVVWAGRKSMQVKAGRADDEAGYPVRILKDALADGVPSQDLLVTPEHCLFFEDKFVPVRMLVNGRSIVYDRSITSYDYFHIETEEHAVIWANDTRTESYLDTGNRATFRQGGAVVRFGQTLAGKSWETDAAASLSVAREVVEPLFRALDARASEVGLERVVGKMELTSDADMHLDVGDGQTIRAARQQGNLLTFMLPRGVESVSLVSRASRPSDVIGPFVDDRRQLGVLVGQITLFDGKTTRALTEHLKQAELSGWYGVENSGRWTNGRAIVSVGLAGYAGLRLLTIEVLAAGPYQVTAGDTVEDLAITG
ncbi:hypothetical protein GOB82_12950 [Acetobacter farinalis]|nr:hypothetical protein [Acetobacter farinalis]